MKKGNKNAGVETGGDHKLPFFEDEKSRKFQLPWRMAIARGREATHGWHRRRHLPRAIRSHWEAMRHIGASGNANFMEKRHAEYRRQGL
jgi:hypothetical protein